jgi:hypothetical protein
MDQPIGFQLADPWVVDVLPPPKSKQLGVAPPVDVWKIWLLVAWMTMAATWGFWLVVADLF